MSAGTRNLDMGRLLRTDRDAPPMPIRSRTCEKVESEQLHIVRVDEQASPTGNSLDGSAKSFQTPRRPLTEYLAEEISVCPKLTCGAGVSPAQAAGTAAPQKHGTEEELALEIPLPREPGVDLAMLQPHSIEAIKLAAFLHDASTVKKDGAQATPQPSPGKVIVMPLAKTDLQEIFQADKICMVARPQRNAPMPAADAEPDRDPPPAACSSIPQQKTPHFLDKTQQYLVENWPKLPPNVQAAILNVIDAAIGPDD